MRSLVCQQGALFKRGLVFRTRNGRQGRLADHLTCLDFVVLDELGYLPFAQSGGQLLFHLIGRLYERTSIIATTNLARRFTLAVTGVAPAGDLVDETKIGRETIEVGGAAQQQRAQTPGPPLVLVLSALGGVKLWAKETVAVSEFVLIAISHAQQVEARR